MNSEDAKSEHDTEDDFIHYYNATIRLSGEVAQLRARVVELETALKFYAVWSSMNYAADHGERARKALGEEENVGG